MSRVEAVVFDIGNVLLGWQPQAFYDQLIGPERRSVLFAEVDLHGMNLRIDRGAPFRATIMAMRDAHPDWAVEIEIWHDRWIEMLAPVISENVALLRSLRANGISVFALSNFGAETFEMARGHYKFLDEFEHRFISGQLGVLKPEPAIYEIVETTTGIEPSALFFIDDNADNIAMASSRGWQTHHFLDPQQLRTGMRTLGLKVPE